MKRNEKIKIAIDVVLLYFIVTTVVLLLHDITSNLWEGINIKVNTLGGPSYLTSNLFRALGISSGQFITPILIIASLTLISILLKKHVQANHLSFIYIISGILLILTGIASIISSEIPNLLRSLTSISTQGNQAIITDIYTNNFINAQLFNSIISISFSIFQIGIGAWFMLVSSKNNKLLKEYPDRTGKLKLATDVALLYFIIKAVISVLNLVISLLLVKDFLPEFNNLWSVIIFCIPWVYSVSIIIFLALISRNLKKKSVVADKSLTYIIAGLMLISTIIISVIMQGASLVHTLIPPRNSIIGFNQSLYAGTIIIYLVLHMIQIGIGAYFILHNVKKDKQQVEEV